MRETTERYLTARSTLAPELARSAFDWSGYTREEAVRELERIVDGRELPFLIWRAGDWVPQVRVPATAAVLSRLTMSGYLPHFVNALPVLARLDVLSRVDMSNLTSAVRYHLLAEAGRLALISGLDSDDMDIRREVCRVLDKAAEVEPSAVEVASRNADSVVRRFVIRWETKLRRVDPGMAMSIRRRMLTDSAPQIRSAALRAMNDAEPEQAADHLKSALDDPSATVRMTARHHLRGSVDFADYYREMVDGVRPPIGAIAGLGETGNAGDFDRVARHLGGSSRQGRAVLKAMAYLDPGRVRVMCFEALIDPRTAVARAALGLLGFRIHEADVIAELWSRGPVNARVLGLATLRLTPWRALEVLLVALDTYPSRVTEVLRQWRSSTNQLYAPTPPSTEVRERLQGLIDAVKTPVPPEIAKRITAALAST